jgi:hypothetical protein
MTKAESTGVFNDIQAYYAATKTRNESKETPLDKLEIDLTENFMFWLCSGQRELCTPLVRVRREFDVELTANPEEPNIFSPSIFWRTTQIMRRKFVEYLGTDCFHFCRFLSSYQRVEYKTYEASSKCRITTRHARWRRQEGGACGSIFHLFLPISPPKK